MITVRAGQAEDVGAARRMAERFLSAEGPYGDRFVVDGARVEQLARYIVAPDAAAAGFVAVLDDLVVGMFAIFCFLHPILGQSIASELCWWVEPEHRNSRAAIKLLRAGEAWAQKSGAIWMEMIAPTVKVEEFYQRVGYTRTDVHYLRRLHD